MTVTRDTDTRTGRTSVKARERASGLQRLSYTPTEAAAVLGISWDSFHRYVAPELRWVRIGSLKLVAQTELQRWLDASAARTLEEVDR